MTDSPPAAADAAPLDGGPIAPPAPPGVLTGAPPDVVALLGKILAVLRDVDDVTPTGWNDQQHYAYASDDDLLRAIRPALIAHGLIVIPATTACYTRTEPRADRQTGQIVGTIEHARLDVCYSIVDAATGASLPVAITGAGVDVQDKAIAKSMTSALKTFLRQTFLLPDAQSDTPAGPPAGGGGGGRGTAAGGDQRPATEAQERMIFAKLKSAGVDDVPAALRELAGKSETRELNRGEVDRIVNALAKGWRPGGATAAGPPAVPAVEAQQPLEGTDDESDIPF